MTDKAHVSRAFSRAAATYEGAAWAQNQSADHLVELITAHPLPANPHVLEVGCGTGLLSAKLMPRLGGDWLLTDLAPAMVNKAQARFPQAKAQTMDGENPDLPPASLDLVTSNLAVQWFSDLAAGLTRLHGLLRPGGLLAVSTMGRGSLAQWRHAHDQLNLSHGLHSWPDEADLAARLPQPAQVSSQHFVADYADGWDFVRSLKAIGANVPQAGHRPLSPHALARVVERMGRPARLDYHILHILWRKED